MPKVGKTTFASKHPKSLIIGFEKGYNALNGVRAVPVNTWAEFIQILNQLKKDKISVDNARAKGEHKETMYETIIIDVVDIAYDACEKYILNREGVDKVKDIPFGAGYGMIEKEFDDRLRSIVQMGYSLILISHATFTSVGDDENAIQIASPTINKRGKKVCSRLVDNYIYISMEQTAEGLERVMHYRGTPYWEAGSRFRYMPESTPLGFKYYKEAMLEAIRKLEEEEGEEAVTDERINNYALPQQKSREAVIDHINEMINKHMEAAAAVSEKEQEAVYGKIAGIIENYLGKGRKLAETTDDQIEQLVLIEDALTDM